MSVALVLLASVWTDLGVPLTIAFVAAALAGLWPWLQALQRGRRFERIIRRELEEIGPYPEEPIEDKPWWEHATKRFVHEEIFSRESISQNRDFLLSLDPTVVYQVSQLWIALDKRDGNQWEHFLDELANNSKVRTDGLRNARDQWKSVMRAQRKDWLESMGIPSTFRQGAVLARTQALFDRRFDAYARLLALTDFRQTDGGAGTDIAARSELRDKLMTWFYSDGAGLLLSGRALAQFQMVREALCRPNVTSEEVREELSMLRTDLKIDLGVRQPRERDVAMAWPEEERW